MDSTVYVCMNLCMCIRMYNRMYCILLYPISIYVFYFVFVLFLFF